MKFLDRINKLFEQIGMIFIVLMILIISIQVFSRYFFSVTPRWSEEVALLLMVWFAFIGISIGVKRESHLSIEYFVSLLPEKIQKVIIRFGHVLVLFSGLFLFYYGGLLAIQTRTSTLPATRLPSSYLYIMVPIAGFLIFLYSIPKVLGKTEVLKEEKE
ncbi:TRAP transporter small permease [Geosporobacter ferrireducens]|uniref:Tripartite ATP-independent periplasmic transporters DctQ component domain-containing protein n=1 Tax=Geosporobacter ferrireducens TaxID=1424294 RepID=A0A1D8GCD1_9FIRM|nr:TRAP transporter small permease [Geosporobacter ferrireducens]AOT68567.1 hypothetical protein Gferi_02530 [Geosporobacter ferrireducens]MTI54035.1 TRAP transporter small permease [Geosporobacter ferrireducens]